MSQFLHNPALILTDSIKQPNLHLSIWLYLSHSFFFSSCSLLSSQPFLHLQSFHALPSTSGLSTKWICLLCVICLFLYSAALSLFFFHCLYFILAHCVSLSEMLLSSCSSALTTTSPSEVLEKHFGNQVQFSKALKVVDQNVAYNTQFERGAIIH